MKTLLILRHAKSSWKDPDLPDHDRSHISKYLYDVPNPYSAEDALNFIKSAHCDFKNQQ
jgi:hypothetical protein